MGQARGTGTGTGTETTGWRNGLRFSGGRKLIRYNRALAHTSSAKKPHNHNSATDQADRDDGEHARPLSMPFRIGVRRSPTGPPMEGRHV